MVNSVEKNNMATGGGHFFGCLSFSNLWMFYKLLCSVWSVIKLKLCVLMYLLCAPTRCFFLHTWNEVWKLILVCFVLLTFFCLDGNHRILQDFQSPSNVNRYVILAVVPYLDSCRLENYEKTMLSNQIKTVKTVYALEILKKPMLTDRISKRKKAWC